MAQKNFKQNNPALSYFTRAAGSTPQQQEQAAPPQPSAQPMEREEQCPLASEEEVDLGVILSEEYARNTRRTYPPKTPRLYETKSKRLNLLIQPSLAADIGKLATLYRISSNELIVRVLSDFTDKRKAEIKKYDRIFLQEE